MLLNYDLFDKRFNVRRLTQLLSPKVNDIESYKLPRSSVYHYFDQDPATLFPSSSEQVFKARQPNKKIAIDHVTELTSEVGNPIIANRTLKIEAKKWNLKHLKDFRFVENAPDVIEDANTYICLNYNLIKKAYRYVNSPVAEYNRWFNSASTKWTTIAKYAKSNLHTHFVSLVVPTALPSLQALRRFENEDSTSMIKYFVSEGSLDILHLFRWLNRDARAKSAMADVEGEALNNIVVVFLYKDLWVGVNLGALDSWIEGSSLLTASSAKQYKGDIVQRLVLKMLHTFVSSYVEPEEEVVDDSDEPQDLIDREEDAPNDTVDEFPHDSFNKDTDKMTSNRNEPASSSGKKPPKYNLKPNDINSPPDLDDDDEIQDVNLTDGDIESVIDDIERELIETGKVADASTQSNQNEINDLTTPLSALDFIADENELENIKSAFLKRESSIDKNNAYLDNLARSEVISAQEYRNLKKTVDASAMRVSPYDRNKTAAEFSKINEAELDLSKDDTTFISTVPGEDTEDISRSTLKSFDHKYTKNILPKDIVAAVSHLENAGLVITNHTVEVQQDAISDYEFHRVTIKPLDGAESTINIRIPRIDEEGNFVASGVVSKMRKQRGEMPIRKVAPNKVVLTSYYGKLFVTRTERKQFNEGYWLSDYISSAVMAGSEIIKKATPNNVFISKIKLPLMYTTLSRSFDSIGVKDLSLMLDYDKREQFLPAEKLKIVEGKDYIVCGHDKDLNPIVIDFNNLFYIYQPDGSYLDLGSFYSIAEIDTKKVPIDFSVVKLLGKDIPLGVVLGFYMGLKNLIKLLDVKPIVVDSTKRIVIKEDEWLLRFKDARLIFKKSDKKATLLLSGYRFFAEALKEYEFFRFNEQAVYLPMLEQRGYGLMHLKELSVLKDLFLDPITTELLEGMGEPTSFLPLLLRANALLEDDQHQDPNDNMYMRVKGYERMAGLMYRELTRSIRQFKFKNIRGKSKVELSPYAVWNAVTRDQTVQGLESINPISDLKQQEAVTYTGSDGLSKDLFSKTMRQYHVNDMGVYSESTVDSSNVAINTYLATDPRFKNLRGVTLNDGSTIEESKLMSTSAMLTPGVMHDSPMRVNFISIQNGHVIGTEGYKQPLMRTGYEYVIPFRAGKLYAYMAEDDGEVVSLTDAIIQVEYINKQRKGVRIGQVFGLAEGTTYAHSIRTDLAVGDKFKKGDAVAYNTSFFERDILNPNTIIAKMNVLTKVAFQEVDQTYEDSSAVSSSFGEVIKTKRTDVKTYILRFGQEIRKLVKKGAQVKPNDVLFYVQDEITGGSDMFNEDTLDTLTMLSNITPKAKISGVVSKIEVLYNGELSDMSPSIRRLCEASDEDRYNSSVGTDKEVKDGAVSSEYRSQGKSLEIDTLELKIYVTADLKAGVGDKIVISAQLKSVIGDVFPYQVLTEHGETIDVLFSYRAAAARVAITPILNGTTNSVLRAIGKKALEIYE